MRKLQILFLLMIGLSITSFSQVQSDTTSKSSTYVIVLRDGFEYLGKLVSDDGREILIITENLGKIYIPKLEIKSITLIVDEEKIKYGEYRLDGPFTTRYSFTTNALPIKKGENYALINLYGPEVHFALTDKFSLGVMSTWGVSPLVLAGKYTFSKDTSSRVNFSIGSLIGSSGYLNNFRGYGGLHFANLTFGSRTKNLTFSGGYAHLMAGFRDNKPAEGITFSDQPYHGNIGEMTLRSAVHGPIISIAGIAKVGAKASFVFDSMLGVFAQKTWDTETTTISDSYWGEDGWVPGWYQHKTQYFTQRTTALFIMPGMRFQKTEKMAFQVSLVGVSVFSWINPVSGPRNLSFPAPLCMWFLKF
ncbi:MAG: hypothetical protein ACPG21_09665 [Crocinitomicaceae bacterium]